MSGSGTDRTRVGVTREGPVVVLVEPQLGENIGMAARAMGNFGLTRLRLVKPRDGWPNMAARRAAAGADHILGKVELFDTVEAAVADISLLFATTARAHDQAKPVVAPVEAAREMSGHIATGAKAGILFGRERSGLENDEVALADRIVTFPVNPGFASLNLAQAVLLMGYEWFKLATEGALPFVMPQRSERASQHQMQAFFDNLVRELDKVEFLRPPEKRDTMLVNLRNIFTRMEPTKQDMHTLHGVVMAIAEGRKGPAKGGVLDAGQGELLREMAAQWPFFHTRLSMLEMVFAKADTGLSAYYDEQLVPQPLQRIGSELRKQLAQDMATTLEILGNEALLEGEPWIRESIHLRNIYTDPLNILQAELLRRNRRDPQPLVERAVMVTIAGIAAGMRNTG